MKRIKGNESKSWIIFGIIIFVIAIILWFYWEKIPFISDIVRIFIDFVNLLINMISTIINTLTGIL